MLEGGESGSGDESIAKKVITLLKKGRHFLGKRMTPSVAAAGYANPSDATV